MKRTILIVSMLCALICFAAIAGCSTGNVILGTWYDIDGNCIQVFSDDTYLLGEESGTWSFVADEELYRFSSSYGYSFDAVLYNNDGEHIVISDNAFYKDAFPIEAAYKASKPSTDEDILASALIKSFEDWKSYPDTDLTAARCTVYPGRELYEYFFSVSYSDGAHEQIFYVNGTEPAERLSGSETGFSAKERYDILEWHVDELASVSDFSVETNVTGQIRKLAYDTVPKEREYYKEISEITDEGVKLDGRQDELATALIDAVSEYERTDDGYVTAMDFGYEEDVLTVRFEYDGGAYKLLTIDKQGAHEADTASVEFDEAARLDWNINWVQMKKQLKLAHVVLENCNG